MIFAELHGKLGQDYSRAHDRAEDLLTSTAFGLLRYLEPSEGHLPLLRCIRRVRLDGSGRPLVELVEGWPQVADVTRVETRFWLHSTEFGEPDVLLTFLDSAGIPRLMVMIEAKLYAPKSGRADEGEAPTDDESSDPDQLVRYWRFLRGLDPGRQDAVRILVYLTRHSTPPADELAASLQREPDMELAWLSWRDVWSVATRAAARSLPAADLARLLAHKGLKRFDGFHAATWRQTPVSRFWTGSRWFSRMRPWVGTGAGHFWRGRK